MMENQFDSQRVEQIRANVTRIKANIAQAAQKAERSPQDIQLMAVTKTVPPEYVNVAIQEGVTLLGENRAQELMEKYDAYQLKADHIHFIGHLQRNKVKYIIDKVSMIHSVDSLELAKEIDKQAKKHQLIMPVLVEVNIGRQETKSGVDPNLLEPLLDELSSLGNISVQGLMAIPPAQESEKYFAKMQRLYIDIKAQNRDNIFMNFLSMGMSADYMLAIQYGANIVRVGSAMFGARSYQIGGFQK